MSTSQPHTSAAILLACLGRLHPAPQSSTRGPPRPHWMCEIYIFLIRPSFLPALFDVGGDPHCRQNVTIRFLCWRGRLLLPFGCRWRSLACAYRFECKTSIIKNIAGRFKPPFLRPTDRSKMTMTNDHQKLPILQHFLRLFHDNYSNLTLWTNPK